jgi:hypothetical protein
VLIKLEAFDRIITLHQQQMQVFEELTMLEQRILCKFLPKSFDHVTLQDLDAMESDDCMGLPIKDNQKKIKQLKRAMLDDLVLTYENKILGYEHQYRQELVKLDHTYSNSTHVNGMSLLDSVKIYMAHRMNQFKRENHFKMMFFSDKTVSSSSTPSYIIDKEQYC